MLYFSDTVWVLRLSSSLPAREGALESSKGDANGPLLLSLLPASELQLVLRDDMADTDREGLSIDISWYDLGGPRAREGGSSISDDCATSGVPYIEGPPIPRMD